MNQSELKQKLQDARAQRLVDKVVEHFWAKIPEQLKDDALYDIICYGAVTDETQKRFSAAVDAALSQEDTDAES